MRLSSRYLLPILGLSLVLPLATLRAEEPAKANGTISGTVKHEDGSALADAQVRVMPAPAKGGGKEGKAERKEPKAVEPGTEKPAEERRPKAVAEAKTDTSGAFSVTVPAGDYVVAAGVKGEGMGRERVSVKAGETATVSITVKKGPGGGAGGEKKPKK